MNIIELARQAANGMLRFDAEGEWRLNQKEVERFAHLVRAQALEEAAGVCDERAHDWHLHAKGGPVSAYNACAAAIRQLKDKT